MSIYAKLSIIRKLLEQHPDGLTAREIEDYLSRNTVHPIPYSSLRETLLGLEDAGWLESYEEPRTSRGARRRGVIFRIPCRNVGVTETPRCDR